MMALNAMHGGVIRARSQPRPAGLQHGGCFRSLQTIPRVKGLPAGKLDPRPSKQSGDCNGGGGVRQEQLPEVTLPDCRGHLVLQTYPAATKSFTQVELRRACS